MKDNRFRCAAYSHLGGPGLVLRVIPSTIKTIEELQLPRGVREVALAGRGLILIVGPSASGKSTTMAAMIKLINNTSKQKVVTIEAPVEYLHVSDKAMITQMEVGLNATSFEHGLKLALQQDADVICISDLRDPEVVRMAVGAAEAGRKVLATITGQGAIPAITRMIAQILPADGDAAVSRADRRLRGSDRPAAGFDARRQIPGGRRGAAGRAGHIQSDRGESSQRSELCHGGPPGRDAVPRPALDRTPPVRSDQRNRGDAPGNQPRSRRRGASHPPSSATQSGSPPLLERRGRLAGCSGVTFGSGRTQEHSTIVHMTRMLVTWEWDTAAPGRSRTVSFVARHGDASWGTTFRRRFPPARTRAARA